MARCKARKKKIAQKKKSIQKKCEQKKKCARPGPITRNPFFNFLRELRQNGCTADIIETAKCGAKLWNLLTPEQKQKYCKKLPKKRKNPNQAACARNPPKKRKNSCKKRKKKIVCAQKKKQVKPRCGPSTPARKRKRKKAKKDKCMKPGPITNNPFLNYIRYFKKQNCGLSPRETVRRAASTWNRMTPEQKNKFQVQACKVTTSARRKRTKLCRSVLSGASPKGRSKC
ncbi:uncharacterized protein LOC119671930 [Teleopsis dalmanni]|uniref:uncharacterized protein LOC119671930 n=1 Tax=Teleopsis dalmanni TaxID=139649 RepID=UPI0018CD385C|nr:uncharacterized protein LOC119671930 [Teleopsis dalmanni]XP_037938756.1 uncharacterized protein LOC119671930 [Teleopsis dalmanni]